MQGMQDTEGLKIQTVWITHSRTDCSEGNWTNKD